MMAFGCTASLALYAAGFVLWVNPALLPYLGVAFVVLLIVLRLRRDPDWPLY